MTKMTTRLASIVVAVLIAAPQAAGGIATADGQHDGHAPTELIVRYHDHVPVQQMRLHAQGAGVALLGPGHPALGRTGLLEVPRGADIVRMARDMSASGLVRYAEPNWRRFPHETPDDPRFPEQYALDNTGGTTATGKPAVSGADLDMLQAWMLETGNRDIVIAVIDGPFDTDHLDLVANLVDGRCFGADCGDDLSDVKTGSAGNGHGTLVAGAAGAVGDNGEGVAGVAWQVSIMPLMTDLAVSSVVEAIDHAIAEGAHIINGSYGGARFSVTEFEAITRANEAGILFVTSAGNFDSDNDKGRLSFPQTYGLPNIVAVPATEARDRLTEWSQFGGTSTRVAAPGEDILAPLPGGAYHFVSGTSVASPQVAGIAALLHARFAGITLDETIARLVAGADMPAALRGRVQGGRANAFNSLQDGLLDTPVLVVDGIDIDDTALGNGNRALDADESADLVVRVASLWDDAGIVTGTLSIPDNTHAQLIAIEQAGAVSADPVTGPPDGQAGELIFGVRESSGRLGNHRVLFRLDLEDGVGNTTTRWFWHEIGLIEPPASRDQTILRDQQDEFHAYHFDVPPGASDLRIATETRDGIDVDLLASFDEPPEYMINLGTDPEGSGAFFQVGENTSVSGEFDGNELITFEAPDSGTWHIVVVNFDRVVHDYRVSVGWCLDDVCPAEVRFGQATITVPGDADSVSVPVVREAGAQGAVSVGFSTVDGDGSALAGIDYTSISGTLSWADGETGTRTFTVPINPERTTTIARTIHVRLADADGAILTVPSLQGIITVQPPPAPPPEEEDDPPRRSGGGALDAVWLALFAILLLAAVRRHRPKGHRIW